MVMHALRSSWNNKMNENKEQATLICCCRKRRKISRRTQCRWIEPVNQIILIWHSWVNGVFFGRNEIVRCFLPKKNPSLGKYFSFWFQKIYCCYIIKTKYMNVLFFSSRPWQNKTILVLNPSLPIIYFQFMKSTCSNYLLLKCVKNIISPEISIKENNN